MDVREQAAVAAGGALGALARAGVATVLLPGPLGTLAVNLTGALALAVLLGRIRHPLLRAGLGTGVLGAWTTFSTFAVEVVDLLGTRPLAGLGLAGASLAGGLAAARLGAALGRGGTT